MLARDILVRATLLAMALSWLQYLRKGFALLRHTIKRRLLFSFCVGAPEFWCRRVNAKPQAASMESSP